MSDAKFEKVEQSDTCLYGPRKLVLCGFEPGVQAKFDALLETLGLAELPRVWAGVEQKDETLGVLVGLENGAGKGNESGLPRAVIMSGITETELHRLMGGARKAGVRDALWATLTPVSKTWTLGALLSELAAEREAVRRKKK